MPDEIRHFLQIASEIFSLLFARLWIGRAQDRSRMRCGHHMRREITFHHGSTISSHAKIFSQQRLRGACAKANQNLRLNNLQLRVQPRTARLNFRMARLLMNASLATLRGNPLEVLHHIGDVDFGPIDADLRQHFVEQPSCRTDERMSRFVFAISGLLSDKHYASSGRAFSEHSLRPEFPKITRFTRTGGALQTRQRR